MTANITQLEMTLDQTSSNCRTMEQTDDQMHKRQVIARQSLEGRRKGGAVSRGGLVTLER